MKLMSNWPRSFFLRHRLVQKPLPMMSAKPDAPRHSRKPYFQGDAERVWEQDRDVERLMPSDELNGAEQGTAR